MTGPSLTARVAAHIAGAAAIPLPDQVETRARLHLLDTLAAIISGTRLRAGRRAIAFAASQAGPAQACVPGTELVTTAIDAAFTAAMCAHADETDDSHLGGRFHPGCAVVPAALALGKSVV